MPTAAATTTGSLCGAIGTEPRAAQAARPSGAHWAAPALALRPRAQATERRTLPTKLAFTLQVSILLLFLAGSSAPTPLYATYQSEWGFSPVTITVVFGVYAVAVLTSLLIVGSLSDHIGRRPVILTAIAMQVLVMAIFATADGLPMLLLARVLQGLATGGAAGALGAGLVDLFPIHGAVANAVGALAGTATGALGSAVLVQLLPAPTHLVYLVLLFALLGQAVGVLFIAETSPRVKGAKASLRPRLHAPQNVRLAVLIAAPSLIAIWALAGFYGSLGPSLASIVVGSGDAIVGGLALFVLAGAGAAAVLMLRSAMPERVMLLGNALLPLGVGLVLLGVAETSTFAFFAGTMIAGTGFGAAFQGALRSVLPDVTPEERAGVLSVVYSISYLAMGLPAIVGGVLAVHLGVTHTATAYGIAVIGLALMTLAATGTRALRKTDRSVR